MWSYKFVKRHIIKVHGNGDVAKERERLQALWHSQVEGEREGNKGALEKLVFPSTQAETKYT